MKTLILSFVAILFAYTGMSQDTSGTRQNRTMQNNTMQQAPRNHDRSRNNNKNKSWDRNSKTGKYNSLDSTHGNSGTMNGRRSGNKNNASGRRSHATESLDSTRR